MGTHSRLCKTARFSGAPESCWGGVREDSNRKGSHGSSYCSFHKEEAGVGQQGNQTLSAQLFPSPYYTRQKIESNNLISTHQIFLNSDSAATTSTSTSTSKSTKGSTFFQDVMRP